MDHITYLERYLALTDPALAEIAIQHGREDWPSAVAGLTALRAAQDALWETFKDSAQQGVNP